jgi:cell division initiation protein
MKFTPLDIQHQQFKTGFRGYDRSEVEAFLKDVSDAMEELVKENAGLKEHLETLDRQLQSLRQKETTLTDLLVTTQTMAENVKQSAYREAELILKEAELKAEDIIKTAQDEHVLLQREIHALQRERTMALEKLRSLLQTFHKIIELEELDHQQLSQETIDPGTRYEDA